MPNMIVDTMIFTPQVVEGKNDYGNMVLKGVIQRAGVVNENKRVYPFKVLKREIGKLQETIRNRQLTGELDHPADSTVRLKEASHLITGAEMLEDGTVIGTVEIIGTRHGMDAKALVESGVRLGISSRGTGTLASKADGSYEVKEDFQLKTWDLVADPSTKGAYIDVVNESKSPNIGDNMSRKNFKSLKSRIETFIRVPVRNLEISERRRSKALGERLIESLDRVAEVDPGYRSLAFRLTERVNKQIDSLERSRVSTPQLRENASLKIISNLTKRLMLEKKTRLRDLRKARKLNADLIKENARLAKKASLFENKYKHSVIVGEEVLNELKKTKKGKSGKPRRPLTESKNTAPNKQVKLSGGNSAPKLDEKKSEQQSIARYFERLYEG